MKTFCYVHHLTDKIYPLFSKNFPDIILVQESRLDQCWQNSDLGRVIEKSNDGDQLVVGDCLDLGGNLHESLEILAVVWEKRLFLLVLSLNNRPGVLSSSWADIFLGLIQADQERRSRRTKNGLAKRKKAGVKLGRPPGGAESKLDRHEKQIREMLDNGVTQKFIAKKYKVHPSTLSQWLKKKEIK